jgi:hypothetical protein
VTAVLVLTVCTLSEKVACGEATTGMLVSEVDVPDPQLLIPATEMVSAPAPDVVLSVLVELDPLQPVPLSVQL